MWKLSIEDDQGHKTVVNLVRDTYSVGRAQENTVRLTERNISRHHATVRKQGSSWVLEDQASYNGCYLNGTRLSEPRPIDHGDLVQLGDYRIEVISEAANAQLAAAAGGTLPQIPRVQSLTGQPDRLVMVVGPSPGMEYPINAPTLVVGRGEESDISINHSSVSRLHCEIRTLGNGRHEIIDRGSANGVRVNGVELERWVLDARDKIELGDIVLKFIPAGMVYRPGVDESQIIPLEGTGGLAGQADTLHPKNGSTLKFAAAGAVVMGIALALGLVILGTHRATPPKVANEQTDMDPSARALSEAQTLLEQGQVEAAHKRVTSGVPESSNARRSSVFRNIENTWADGRVEAAEQEPDRERKRELLEGVVKSTTVDSERRRRAADALAALDTAGIAVTELTPAALPSAEHLPSSDPQPAPATPTAQPRTGLAPLPVSSRAPIHRDDPYADPAPRRSSEAIKAPKAPVPNALDEATSGDRSKQQAAKDALKAKCSTAQCTDQERRTLLALCRDLADPACSH